MALGKAATVPRPFGTGTGKKATGGGVLSSTRWPQARIELAQSVWGENQLCPETAALMRSWTTVLGLDPAMNVIEIGAGLGGLSRYMHLQSGVYTLGFESDPALREAAETSASQWGLRRKTRFASFDAQNPEFKGVRPGTIDRALLHSTLPKVRNPLKLVAELAGIMRNGGQILIGEVFLKSGAINDPLLSAWQDAQTHRGVMATVDDFEAELENQGFEVHVNADMTPEYCSAISQAWTTYLAKIFGKETSVKSLSAALAESECWMLTRRAMKNNVIEFRRITATLRQ